MKPPTTPIARGPRRNKVKDAAGKAVFESVIAGHDAGLLSPVDLSDACYYLDSGMFLPTGGGKASRAIRSWAKKRGVL